MGITSSFSRTRSGTLAECERLDIDTKTWAKGALDGIFLNAIWNYGTMEDNSVILANKVVVTIKGSSMGVKIPYLIPFLGRNVWSAYRPLKDDLAAGIPDNGGPFNENDYTQRTGLKGNGAGKYLDSKLKPNQIGSSDNGGLGYWENDYDGSGTSTNEVMGSTSNGEANRYTIVITVAPQGVFRWGANANQAIASSASTHGHYYGQRSSSTSREIFYNGSSIATNTNSDTASGDGDNTMMILAVRRGPASAIYWKGRCGCAYFTDGTLTSDEISYLDTVLRKYLFTMTGRPAS